VSYGIDGHQEDLEFTKKECALLAEIILNIRNLRTSNSVFDTGILVKGGYGAYLNRTSKVWDNVAQQIIVEEAGGVYTDFSEKKLITPISWPTPSATSLSAPPPPKFTNS